MYLTIDVNQEVISKGRRTDCNRCPIAIALRNAGATNVSVNWFAHFIYNGKKYTVKDKRIDNFIHVFDWCEKKSEVKPVKMTLNCKQENWD
jgi:hypothetical protein